MCVFYTCVHVCVHLARVCIIGVCVCVCVPVVPLCMRVCARVCAESLALQCECAVGTERPGRTLDPRGCEFAECDPTHGTRGGTNLEPHLAAPCEASDKQGNNQSCRDFTNAHDTQGRGGHTCSWVDFSGCWPHPNHPNASLSAVEPRDSRRNV